MDIITGFFNYALTSGDPRLVWLAMIIVVISVFKWISPELKAAFRLIKPISIERMAAAEEIAGDEMTSIAKDFGVGRAYIALFHNGTKSAANVHFLKMSIMVEGLSGKVGPILSSTQNRNLAEYGDFGYRLIRDKEYISIENIESIKETMPGVYTILHLNLVKSIHAMPIIDPKTSAVDGCVFVEHCVSELTLDRATMLQIQSRAQTVYNGLYRVNNVK
jgi:hypothetical protein